MTTTIYYFSGTGNSLKIARDLQSELSAANLIRICKKNMAANCDSHADRIGIVFPVYQWGLPLMVAEFLKDLRIKPDAYVFAVANYGGGTGISFEQVEEILAAKGARLSAAFGVFMPGNMWFIRYPHKIPLTQQRLADQGEATRQIAKAVGKMAVVPAAVSPTRTVDEERHRAFSPYRQDEDFRADENCTGCGLCAKVCPADNIKIVDKRPVWQHQCEQCLACLHWCPNQAIQIGGLTADKMRYHHPAIKVQALFG
jgi:MinD superfamily P-loop ATPase containing an inserted ferredoxin domain